MKKFLVKIAYTVFPLWVLFVGAYCYFIGYVEPNATGDLAVIGHMPLDKTHILYPDKQNTLPLLSEEIYDTAQISGKFHRVLVIGDSFSQRENNSFHNYLAHDGYSVANVRLRTDEIRHNRLHQLPYTDSAKRRTLSAVEIKAV